MTQETEYERSETSHMAGTGAGRAGWGVEGVLAGGEKREGPGDREEVETRMTENHKMGKREYCNI